MYIVWGDLEINHRANHHVSRHVMDVTCANVVVIHHAFLHQSFLQIEHILCRSL